MRAATWLCAAFVAAACVGGQLAATPAMADQEADGKSCFSGDDNAASARVGACTRFIDSATRDLAGAYNWRGEAHRLLKEYDLAIADFARAIEFNPQSVYPYANRAEVYRLQGRYDLVIRDTTEAIRIDPGLNASYAIRGMAYEKTGDLDRARADFNKALSLPVKGNDGQWAQDVARNRLQAIGTSGENSPGNNPASNPGSNPGSDSGRNTLMNR
jgi:tetratricopeptide (TPR) repeat protein